MLSPRKISAVRFAEQASPESSQSAQLPVTPHPKAIPAEAREELLRQQFEDQLYVDTFLRGVWRVKELAQLNGAEMTETVKHFEELAPECNLVSWILSPCMDAVVSSSSACLVKV